MPDEIKIYPAEKQQLDAYNQQLSNYNSQLQTLNSKIPLPTYQVKTVMPSNIQQTIEPDNGYTGLSAVVVNPIAALMPENLEDFVMRKSTMPEFSLSLSGDVPAYACYSQRNLVAVYGEITSVGEKTFMNCTNLKLVAVYGTITSVSYSSFDGCRSLEEIDLSNLTILQSYSFSGCASLKNVDCRNAAILNGNAFQSCTGLQAIDCRNVTEIKANSTFQNCFSLLLIDISNTHNALLGSTTCIPNNGLTILVADTTDKAYYQSATNWSTYASKIKTVAEFEQEIGMSYDDYYLQVFGHARN